MKSTIIGLITVVVLIIACSKGSDTFTTTDCSGVAKSFATDVSPIIQTFCATGTGCHASGSSNGPGALTTYSQVFNARVAIRAAVASGRMPLNSSLTDAQKNTIICWIDNGATSN